MLFSSSPRTRTGPRIHSTLRLRVLGSTAVAGLLLAAGMPAVADPGGPDPSGVPVVEWASAPSAPNENPQPIPELQPGYPDVGASTLDASASDVTADASDAIETRSGSSPIAPGVAWEGAETFDPAGWQVANALTVDLSKGASVGYLSSGSVAQVAPLPSYAQDAGAVAAVNGDFYDINNSGSPIGPAVADGRLLKSPSGGWNRVVAFDETGAARITDLGFDGAVGIPDASLELARLNSSDLPADGIGAYNEDWGDYTRTRAVQNVPAGELIEVLVADGAVTQVSDTPGAGRLPAGTVALVGREQGANALSGLAVGDPVSVEWDATAADGRAVRTAVGGRALLVADGQAQDVNSTLYAARTAIGMSADGTRLVILATDGDNRSHSRGATLAEMADLMVEYGVHTAMELDGGGSSTVVSRLPGEEELNVNNTPSDGSVRSVSNGLGIFAPTAPPGTAGDPAGLRVTTALDPEQAAAEAPVGGQGRPDRVFPGLTRTLTATPYDPVLDPATGADRLRWGTSNGHIRGGILKPYRSGTTEVVAKLDRIRQPITLEVLGRLTTVAATERSLNLPNVDDTATFGLVGFDADGNRAPIEPADVELEYDTSLLSIEPDGVRGFTVVPLGGNGATLVEARVAGVSTSLGVSVGAETHVLDTFDDPIPRWHARGTRATAEVTAVPDGRDGAGLKLSYDFTQATATRLGIAELDQPLGADGQARAFGLSIRGTGTGEWMAFTFIDAEGRTLPAVYGPLITWEGWQTVELAVPEDFPDQLTFKRLTIIETSASRQYASEVVIDDLYVKTAPEVTVPPIPHQVDRVVVQDDTVADADWRLAVFGDAQFVARNPGSPQAEGARRTLREIRATDPDFLVIAGDFVDEGSDADFELARRILDEEIGDSVPYYYVPGNHEVMGADIGNFERHFGETHQTFDHRGTRFVTMDTSRGTLRGGGFEQVAMLRDALDSAAADSAISSVVVIEHHPPRDPTAAKNSQLADRHEAALMERWLAEFQSTTGKGAAFIGGHVGLFHTSRVDGVPYVVIGNSGKNPAGPPEVGGYTGWARFGVDADGASSDWISAELRPHTDELTVSAPETLRVGETAQLSATVRQDDLDISVGPRFTSIWEPGPHVFVGPADKAGRHHVAAFDPRTRELTALRRGETRITVTVNDVTRSTVIRLTR